MTKTKSIALLLCVLFPVLISAQEKDSLTVRFHFKFDDANLVPNNQYVSKQNDTLQIDAFRFYVSDVAIHYADNSILKISGSHLIDLEFTKSQKIAAGVHSQKGIKRITFAVGVDSLASVSGALSGDLDPAKGMYWAWQSGYINMKIEGKSPSCKTRKNQFQFHIGGYLKPNNALRLVAAEIPKMEMRNSSIIVNVDLAKLADNIDLKTQNSITIPGKESMAIANLATKMFTAE